MKNNFLSLKDEKGIKKDYRILLDIKGEKNKKSYIIYTDEEKNENGDVRAFVSSYILSDKGNMTKLKEVTSKDELSFVSKILYSLESGK